MFDDVVEMGMRLIPQKYFFLLIWKKTLAESNKFFNLQAACEVFLSSVLKRKGKDKGNSYLCHLLLSFGIFLIVFRREPVLGRHNEIRKKSLPPCVHSWSSFRVIDSEYKKRIILKTVHVFPSFQHEQLVSEHTSNWINVTIVERTWKVSSAVPPRWHELVKMMERQNSKWRITTGIPQIRQLTRAIEILYIAI